MTYLDQLGSRQLIVLLTAASALLIAGAWTFQAIGYEPCALCYTQRNPHYAAIAIGLVAAVMSWGWLAWAGAVSLAATSAVGFYHSGVERHWWPGPASCTASGGGDLGSMSASDLLGQLQGKGVVLCDEIPWRLSDAIPLDILDITMANFNALGSLVLAGLWVYAGLKAARGQ